MKDYRIIFISFVLLVFMIGAVSAVDGENITTDDNLELSTSDDSIVSEDNDVKEIYVSTVGDDSNTGTKESPYATINKAFYDVNAADKTTVYIGEGTFLLSKSRAIVEYDSGTRDEYESNGLVMSKLQYAGGDLKFIGAGADKTFLDGQSSYSFLKMMKGSIVTVKDISFINCNNQNSAGVITNSASNLTIENCIFKNCKATSVRGGVISSDESRTIIGSGNDREIVFTNANTTIINSQFISCSINTGYSYSNGGIIYSGISNLYLENNSFINMSASQYVKGSAIYVTSDSTSHYGDLKAHNLDTKSTIINNRFINITGVNDASIYVKISDASNQFIAGNEFVNCSCTSDQYSVVTLVSGNIEFKNNSFVNSTNSVGNIYNTAMMNILKFEMDYAMINVSDTEINNGLKINKFKVTDDKGNIVKLPSVNVNLKNDDYWYSYISNVSDGNLLVTFSDVPINGIYDLIASYGNVTTDVLSKVNVSLVNDFVELWVSPKGFDGNEGTQENPFATIQHAIDVGFENSFSVIVHVLKGTYTKEGNVALTIANKGYLEIIGEYNETVIDGEGRNWFLDISTTNVKITNLKFVNGTSYKQNYVYVKNLISGGNRLSIENCIFENNTANRKSLILDAIKFNKTLFINNHAGSIISSNCKIVDSIFSNNMDVYLLIEGGIIENSKFINNTPTRGKGFLSGIFTSVNNYYAGTYPGSAVSPTGDCEFINDTFANNNNEFNTGGAISITHVPDDVSNTPVLIFENCKFINNSASYGGVSSLKIGRFTDCSFINNTADYGGAFYIVPYVKNANDGTVNSLEFINSIFENNVANLNGDDMYLELPSDWKVVESKLAYALPLTITFDDRNVTLLADDLTATVYGPCGAVISTNYLTFELNGTRIAAPKVVNSHATFNYAGFDEGNYILMGNTEYPNAKNVINPGLISVKLENVFDHIDVWVSPDGSDENGNGSEDNPFKSISHAISESILSSHDVTVYLKEGTYSGDLNTGLTISSINNITIIGAGLNKTVINGNDSTYFAIINQGKNKVIVSNLTIKNMKSSNDIAPILVEANSTLCLDNVCITGFKSSIVTEGSLFISDSIITKNLDLFISYDLLCINNTLICSSVGQIKGKTIINNSVIRDILTHSIDSDLFARANTPAIATDHSPQSDEYCIIENTVISNDCTNSSFEEWAIVELLYYDGAPYFDAIYYGNLYPAVSFRSFNVTLNNVSIVNNYNSEDLIIQLFGMTYEIKVHGSSFTNFNSLWRINTYGAPKLIFDGCVFNNITMIGEAQTFEEGFCIISNSVFIDSDPVIDRHGRSDREDPTCIFDNNYWGNNDKIVVTYINPARALSFEPATWIILVEENGIPVFKLTDGKNIIAYEGSLPAKVSRVYDNGEFITVLYINGDGYKLSRDEDGSLVLNTTEVIKDVVPEFPVDETVFAGNVEMIENDGSKFTANFTNRWGDSLKDTKVSFVIGDKTINATTDVNGTASFVIDFALGKYLVNTVNPLTGQSINNTVSVMTEETTFASDVKTVQNEGSKFEARFTDEFGVPLANTSVSFKVDDDVINAVTDANGIASFIIDFNLGEYLVNTVNPVTGQSIFNKVVIISKDTVSANDINATYKDNSKFSAKFTDKFGNRLANTNVTFIVENITINTTTDANGIASFTIDFHAGTYNVSSINPVTSQSVDNKIIVSPLASKLTASNVTMIYNTDKSLTAILKDVNENALAKQDVFISINGKTYKTTTDANGQVSFKITLPVKTYTATITFKGDNNYINSIVKSTVVVNKATPKLTAKKATFKAKKKTKKYSITLKDNKGKAIKKAKVTFKVKGKTYKATTNNKGKATFKITKLTKKGKYKATIKYTGNNNFKAVTKTIKYITIKK